MCHSEEHIHYMSFHLTPENTAEMEIYCHTTVEFHLPPPRRGFTWEVPAEYEEKFFYCVGARALEQLPKEVVESPSPEMFKTHSCDPV